MYEIGKMTIPAGRVTPPTATSLAAVVLAVSRQVTKSALHATKRQLMALVRSTDILRLHRGVRSMDHTMRSWTVGRGRSCCSPRAIGRGEVRLLGELPGVAHRGPDERLHVGQGLLDVI